MTAPGMKGINPHSMTAPMLSVHPSIESSLRPELQEMLEHWSSTPSQAVVSVHLVGQNYPISEIQGLRLLLQHGLILENTPVFFHEQGRWFEAHECPGLMEGKYDPNHTKQLNGFVENVQPGEENLTESWHVLAARLGRDAEKAANEQDYETAIEIYEKVLQLNKRYPLASRRLRQLRKLRVSSLEDSVDGSAPTSRRLPGQFEDKTQASDGLAGAKVDSRISSSMSLSQASFGAIHKMGANSVVIHGAQTLDEGEAKTSVQPAETPHASQGVSAQHSTAVNTEDLTAHGVSFDFVEEEEPKILDTFPSANPAQLPSDFHKFSEEPKILDTSPSMNRSHTLVSFSGSQEQSTGLDTLPTMHPQQVLVHSKKSAKEFALPMEEEVKTQRKRLPGLFQRVEPQSHYPAPVLRYGIDEFAWAQLPMLLRSQGYPERSPAIVKKAFLSSQSTCSIVSGQALLAAGRLLTDFSTHAMVCDVALIPEQQASSELFQMLLNALIKPVERLHIILLIEPSLQPLAKQQGFQNFAHAMALLPPRT